VSPLSLAGADLVLVYPVPKGAIGDTDLASDPGNGIFLLGSSTIRIASRRNAGGSVGFVAMFSFPRTVLSLKQSTEPTQVQSYDLEEIQKL